MIRIEPAGTEALLLVLAERPDPALPLRLTELIQQLREQFGEALPDLVPGWTSLLLHYDLRRIQPQVLEQRLRPLLEAWRQQALEKHTGRLHEIAVWYAGKDLEAVARNCRLTPEQVITLHCGRDYQIGAIGFAPGFAYLGELDERLALPRRETPRTYVPAGSLAIAERQTAIYPQASPGGWHLLGRSPVRLFDPQVTPPCALALGDKVRFVPVEHAEYLAMGGKL